MPVLPDFLCLSSKRLGHDLVGSSDEIVAKKLVGYVAHYHVVPMSRTDSRSPLGQLNKTETTIHSA